MRKCMGSLHEDMRRDGTGFPDCIKSDATLAFPALFRHTAALSAIRTRALILTVPHFSIRSGWGGQGFLVRRDRPAGRFVLCAG
jgi:hypothetical protein